MNRTIISVTSTKGGVGKTTISANLGALLAGLGYKVLLIDADVQPSLSGYFAIERRSPKGLHSCITRGGVLDQDCISKTYLPNLDIVISDEREVCVNGVVSLQAYLSDRADRLIVMKRALRCEAAERYDYVIIDTQGAVGELQRTAAMAANIILATIKPDILSATEFDTGTRQMIATLSLMSDFGSDLVPGKVYALINGTENTSNARAIADYIREQYRTSTTLQMLVTTVPSATAFALSATRGVPAYLFDKRASEVMHKLAQEIFPNLVNQFVETPARARAAKPAVMTSTQGGVNE